MSRPPTMPQQQQYSNPIPMGPVVNGGLIDFHDAIQQQYYAPYAQYPYPPQQAAPQSGQYQPAYPPQQAVPQSGQYLAGPPSFLHLNGQVYKPVVAGEADPTPPAPPPPSQETKKLSKPARNVEQEIERRVAAKVDEFMARSATKAATRSARKPPAPDTSRLRDLNAQMRRLAY